MDMRGDTGTSSPRRRYRRRRAPSDISVKAMNRKLLAFGGVIVVGWTGAAWVMLRAIRYVIRSVGEGVEIGRPHA